MAPTKTKSDKKIQYDKERKERKRKEKEEAKAAAVDKSKAPPKQLRRDWAAMKASLVFNERGVGTTPDGLWTYWPKAELASEKALPAGHASERACWMYMGFEEDGEKAREMMPGTDDEEEGEGEGEGDVEMGEGGELEGGVEGLALE